MRAQALPSLILGVCLLSGCQPEGTGREEEATGGDGLGRTPAGLVSLWVDMWNSYDLDRVRELFLTDDRLTYFSSEYEGVIRGFAAVVEHHRGFGFVPGGEEGETRLWVEELTEDVFGSAAVLSGIWYFERPGSDEPPQRGPVTLVCVLEEGRWRFAHMNFGSYPATQSG